MSTIYLDFNATTPVDDRVLEAMLPYFKANFANAASTDHAPGDAARRAVEQARGEVAHLIGAEPEEIVFTSGATEADNLAVFGTMARASDDAEIVVSAVEHPAVLEAARRFGDRLRVVRVSGDGRVDPDEVRRQISSKTALVCVMAANNETGAIQPIEEVGDVCAAAGVPLHVDAVQAASRLPVDVRRSGAATLALSAHKMYGPKGVGGLFVRRRRPRAKVAPIFHGGGHERNLRPGTLNVPAIVGFGVAARLARNQRRADADRERALRDQLLALLNAECPAEVVVNSPHTACLPQTVNARVTGVASAGVLRALSERVAVASGSACATTSVEPSHVLTAQGLSRTEVGESLRISFGRQTTLAELDRFVTELADVVTEVRRFGARSAA